MTDAPAIIDALAIPVLAFDGDLRLRVANAPARALFADADVGADAGTVFGRKSAVERLRRVLRGGHGATLALKPKTARDRDLFLTFSRVGTRSDSDTRLALVTVEDRSPLREAKAMRSDFVANVSHEIRSPLTAVSGFVETLQGPAGGDPAARAHFLALMEKEATRMKNLVADLLSLSQVQAKENRELRKPADLETVLGAAVEAVSKLAAQRGKTVTLKIAGPLPVIAGHTDNLLRVFINLLENALNYSRDGATVEVTSACREADRRFPAGSIEVAVRDQGDGIAAEEIPRLTERFYRVDKSRSRNLGGTGLGLAIVKHILVRHRGRLEITSEAGAGSTFTVRLPLPSGPLGNTR